MSLDLLNPNLNNGYTGVLFGKDRIGHITPDAEFGEPISEAWLPANEMVLPSNMVANFMPASGGSPIARVSPKKLAVSNISRAGAVTKASTTYNAASLR